MTPWKVPVKAEKQNKKFLKFVCLYPMCRAIVTLFIKSILKSLVILAM